MVVTSGEADVLLPPVTGVTTAINVVDLLFSRLAELGLDLNTVDSAGFRPVLARSWERHDSTTLVFHLDPRARWQDGQPVTADDVVFTFDVYRDTLVGSPFRPNLASIDSATKVDSLSVAFHFARWYPEQLYDATYHMRVLPQHLLAGIPRAQLASSPFARHPVGCGPFRFVEWRAAEEIDLAADTTYFLGPPKLRRLVFRVVPDIQAAVSVLAAGEGDAIEYIPQREQLDRARALPDFRLVPYASPTEVYVVFNLRRPLFADRDIRRAMAMAVNREAVVRSIFGPYAEVPVGATTRMQWIWSDSIRQLPFDPAAAARMLEERGWRDTNGDGVREKGGAPLRFTLLVPTTSQTRQHAAVLIQAQLKAVGVDMRIRPLDFNVFEQRSVAKNFDAAFHSRALDPSPAGLLHIWTSEGIRHSNYGSYASPAFDSLVRRAIYAPSRALAQPLWREALGLLNEDAPAIFVYSPQFNAPIHRRFEHVTVRPDSWLATVAEWSVPPERRLPRDQVPAGQ